MHDDMKIDELLEFAWHDAEIIDINIDRSEPGHRDTVGFVVSWAEWQPRPEENISIVEFSNCYALEMQMNFGVIALETIHDVYLEPEHPKLFEIRNFYKVENLNCIVFETNSTASFIRVFATSVRIVPYSQSSTVS